MAEKNSYADSFFSRLFDSVIHIDVATHRSTVRSLREAAPAEESFNYDVELAPFIRRHVVAGEAEPLIRSMQLHHVCAMLELQEEYVLYATSRAADGGFCYKKLSFFYLDSEKKTLGLSGLDVSEIVQRYERQINHFRRETYRDLLTGTLNRNCYEQNLRSARLNAGVAVIDLDDFKLCNDIYGHTAGDAALTALAEVIRGCIRKSDILIRYGGDEFLLVMPDIGADELEGVLLRIQNRVLQAEIPGYPELRLSASIGGVSADDRETVEQAVERADALMYQGKTRKNMVVTERAVLQNEHGQVHRVDRETVRQQILIVDDSEINRAILTEMLNREFRVLEAENGEECLRLLGQYGTGIALILLDIRMPVMDGFGVLSAMNESHRIEDVPVVMISCDDSADNIRRAYEFGASDYISRPFDAEIVYRRVTNTLKLYSRQRHLLELLSGSFRDRRTYDAMTTDILGRVIGRRNGESGAHLKRISELTQLLLLQLIRKTDRYALSVQDCSRIASAATLHDIGKLGVRETILNKPGKLTPEEFESVKTHTVLGEAMLNGLEEYRHQPFLHTAAQICRWHHERYDGKGYPDGLCGEDIPIAAQAVSLADVYDALTGERVYKPAYSHERAMEMIRGGECGAFNPLLLSCLEELGDRLRTEWGRS